jgi:hypothetical protein
MPDLSEDRWAIYACPLIYAPKPLETITPARLYRTESNEERK